MSNSSRTLEPSPVKLKKHESGKHPEDNVAINPNEEYIESMRTLSRFPPLQSRGINPRYMSTIRKPPIPSKGEFQLPIERISCQSINI